MRSLYTRAALVVLASSTCAHAQFSGPTPYLSAADSPFAPLSFSSFFLEDFEDENPTTGLGILHADRIGPSNFTDSVDADDGSIDGSGTRGSSLITDGFFSDIQLTFDDAALGAFPTHVGFVWTDVGFVFAGQTGFAALQIEAFDALDNSIGTFGPFDLGDGASTGATAEDRFFGVSHPAGISRLVISMPDSTDWEIDHVQYGIIPAPTSALVLSALAFRRRNRR
jgi:hypothetical protein